jgi:hypothetical protein
MHYIMHSGTQRNATAMATRKSNLLLSPEASAAAATAGAGFLNASAVKIQKARADGPLTFQMLGFLLGGLAMIVSNGIAILER